MGDLEKSFIRKILQQVHDTTVSSAIPPNAFGLGIASKMQAAQKRGFVNIKSPLIGLSVAIDSGE